MAKYLTVAQLEKQFDTMFRSLKELARVKILEPVTLIADQAKAIADSVRRDADNGLFDGAPGERGPKGDRGEPGEPGGVTTVNGRNGAVTLTAADVGARTADWFPALPNRNLLDNGWFTINQRSAASLSPDGYKADRWKTYDASGTINDGYISISTGQLYQTLENNLFEQLLGKTVTLSVRLRDGSIRSASAVVDAGATYFNLGLPLAGCRLSADGGAANQSLRLIPSAAAEISAVKLELGGVSTLAYDLPPDYAQELEKCRYYFRRLGGKSTSYKGTGGIYSTANRKLFLSLQTGPMRTLPAITSSGTIRCFSEIATSIDVESMTVASQDNENTTLVVTMVNPLDGGKLYTLRLDSAAYIDLSADL